MLQNLRSGATVWLIGDPHLGKNFEVGVPLHRRGEREARQMAQFKEELNTDADYIVIVGDLFDHPYVSYAAVLDTYKAIVNAATANPGTSYIIYPGNHDLPRNVEAVGAFHLLERLLHLRAENIRVIIFPQQVGHIMVFPWQWDIPAKNSVVQNFVSIEAVPVELIVGHWDLELFGENDEHLAPTVELREIYGPDVPIVSGHFHVEGDYKINGHVVHCTGSMQPYSHGEDPEGEYYVTLTTEDLDKVDLHDKCVRILLKDGEDMPEGVDCLAIIPKRVAAEVEAEDVTEDFNWNDIIQRKLEDVPQPAHDYIKDRLQ